MPPFTLKSILTSSLSFDSKPIIYSWLLLSTYLLYQDFVIPTGPLKDMPPISSSASSEASGPASHFCASPILLMINPLCSHQSGSYPDSGSSEYGSGPGTLPQRPSSDKIRMNRIPSRGEARCLGMPSYLICLSASSTSQFRDSLDCEWRGVTDCITESVLLTSDWTNSFTVQMVSPAVKT